MIWPCGWHNAALKSAREGRGGQHDTGSGGEAAGRAQRRDDSGGGAMGLVFINTIKLNLFLKAKNFQACSES
jgi:hypothetical protein